jgi:hypothetical protein
VGLAGFEPVTFARNHDYSKVSTGFFLTAPEFRHSVLCGQQTQRFAFSGARRHTGLDYSPTTTTKLRATEYIFYRRMVSIIAKRKPYQLPKGVFVGVAGQRARDPPDPIPNSEVKPRSVFGVSVGLGHVKPRKLAAPLLQALGWRRNPQDL